MFEFGTLFCLAGIATLLFATGGAHLVDLRGFRETAREHRILHPSLVEWATASVVVSELAVAGAAAWLVLSGASIPGAFLAACLLLAAALLTYGVALLRYRPRVKSCGCSALEGPLTEASLLPSSFLLAATVALTVGAVIVQGRPVVAASWAELALAVFAGSVTAALVLLVPASMPAGGRA